MGGKRIFLGLRQKKYLSLIVEPQITPYFSCFIGLFLRHIWED